MKFRQRDVVYYTAKMPDGKVLKHPYIIISCNKVNTYERYYTGVMITGSIGTDKFTFPLSDSMFERPLTKISAAKVRLIVPFCEDDVEGGILSRMRKEPFRALINELKTMVLAVDEND